MGYQHGSCQKLQNYVQSYKTYADKTVDFLHGTVARQQENCVQYIKSNASKNLSAATYNPAQPMVTMKNKAN